MSETDKWATRFAVLTALRAYPNKSVTGLVKLTGYRRSAVKRQLRELEGDGLIECRLVPEPGRKSRAKRSQLTRAGKRAWEVMKDER